LPADLTAGLITQEQHEFARRVFQDPTLYFPSYTLFCAWGRKPLQIRLGGRGEESDMRGAR